jgi:hypothetical protein
VATGLCASSRLWARAALGVPFAAAVALWRCPVAALLGVPCPGCGLTRAVLALVAGDIDGAMRLHPLAPVLVVFGLWLAARELVAVARPGVRRMCWGGREEGLSALLCGCLIALWIARFFGAFGGPV